MGIEKVDGTDYWKVKQSADPDTDAKGAKMGYDATYWLDPSNGEEAKATAAFKRSILEGKGFQPEAYTGLGILYKEKAEGLAGSGDFEKENTNYTEAAKNFRSAVKQLSGAPDAIVVYQLLGLVYERQKKYTEAIGVYEEFLRLFPNAAEAEAVRSFIVQIKKDMASQD